MAWGVLIALIGIVVASIIGGAVITNYAQLPGTSDSQVQVANNTVLVDEPDKFDIWLWLTTVPIFPAIQNLIDGFMIMTKWIIHPLSTIVCAIARFFNPSATCLWYSGFLILLPFFIVGIWGLTQRSQKWLMMAIIIISIVFVVGIILSLTGVI